MTKTLINSVCPYLPRCQKRLSERSPVYSHMLDDQLEGGQLRKKVANLQTGRDTNNYCHNLKQSCKKKK